MVEFETKLDLKNMLFPVPILELHRISILKNLFTKVAYF